MTFSEKAKNEILNKNLTSPCCRVAGLSAFIRGAGTISVESGDVGFEIVTENVKARDVYAKIIETDFNEKVDLTNSHDKFKGKDKFIIKCLSKTSIDVLRTLGILVAGNDGVSLNLGIDKYLIQDDCCKKAYVSSAFVGSGSVTVPSTDGKSSTGYHLEFVFSQYHTASDFSVLLTELGFFPRVTSRKENFVVYFKTCEEIRNLLFYMGATKCCFELDNIVIENDIRNDTNRRINCEMANIDKQILASQKQIASIKVIMETIGLDTLSDQLQQAVELRLNNPESTLEDLANMAGVSKSCFNHRMRKIVEISKNLKN